MVFSSPIFLFLFLPVVLGVYVILPKSFWNAWLLVASLLFYAWGERGYSSVMLLSIAMNYVFGVLIDQALGTLRAHWVLGIAVAANLGLLIAFKYANFLAPLLNVGLRTLGCSPVTLRPVHLPVGISFFTFHALSYVVDVYRSHARVQRDPAKLALYITLFPQLIAGPILRFHEVAHQIDARTLSLTGFAAGVRRFVIGLAKKVLLANTLAAAVDQIFLVPVVQLKPLAAWLALISYALQIYFDFSGYSDMALGLGRMLGFHFPENFNYPYISRSVQEFWRRWHISLSTWFRDYLYIPLGGSRTTPFRHYRNLLLVFFLCGLWHGASWNFVLWGLFHGFFLLFEGLPFTAMARSRIPRFIGHAYTLLVVMIGWVFFRTETLPKALDFLRALVGAIPANGEKIVISTCFNSETQIAFACALVCCLPWISWLGATVQHMRLRWTMGYILVEAVEPLILSVLFLLSVMHLAAGTYNPFIYFRF